MSSGEILRARSIVCYQFIWLVGWSAPTMLLLNCIRLHSWLLHRIARIKAGFRFVRSFQCCFCANQNLRKDVITCFHRWRISASIYVSAIWLHYFKLYDSSTDGFTLVKSCFDTFWFSTTLFFTIINTISNCELSCAHCADSRRRVL